MSNEAAWIKQKQAQLEVGPAERFAVHPIPYPNILGTSYAGSVEAVGAGVQAFNLALASATSTSKLPPSAPLNGAATALLNLAAVASALTIHLGLDPPSLSGAASPKGKTVLIYGGSSSTGGLATKYASSAGYTVVTTASPAHRAFVKSLNPAYIIDYTQPPAHGPYAAIFDAIGLPPVTNQLFDYLASVGGGAYNAVIPPLGGEKPTPPGVERRFAPYSFAFAEPANADFARWFYEEYVPRGLESGLVVPTRPQVVEGGLEQVQYALDLMDQGKVSGRKLVLYPWGEPAGL